MFLVFIFALLLSNLILTNIFFQFQFTAMQSALFLKYVEVQSLNLPKKLNHIVIFRDALIAIFLADSDFFCKCGLSIPIFDDSDFLSKNYNWQHSSGLWIF